MNLLLATSDNWSLGDMLLSMLYFFLFIIWIWIFISIVSDVFRDHELGGVGKAAWLLVLIFLPFLSALVYLIARGDGMRDRTIKHAVDIQKAQNAYIREVAGSPVDDLSKLNDLKNSGVLTQEEFDRAKGKALADHHGE
ncbi:MAG: SHOCT domain-containing protein [Solirubrobacterales bacterium]|nr:SHOCT domain-containing protein [Solirubrobacterales bacterium]